MTFILVREMKSNYPPTSYHEDVLINRINKSEWRGKMTGKVLRVVEQKGFGFIKSDVDSADYFFHKTGFDGHWDDMVADLRQRIPIMVEFDTVMGTKGPRAENVRRLDNGVVLDKPEG